jgi:cytochrome c-type biogenesis protein CcsB
MDDATTGHMRQKTLQRSSAFYSRPTILYGIAFLAIAIAIAVGAVYLEAGKLISSFVPGQSLSQHLISYANLLLIGSTVIYVGHLWVTAKVVGQLATGMATMGAMGVTVALLVSWFEISYMLHNRHAPLSSLYDVTALFSAVTVVIYLAMEKVYHTRAAGAFVMPIVVGAVLFESLLLSGDQGIAGHLVPELKSYWMHAHVLSDFVGYGAFAIAASLGIMYLFRQRAEQGRRTEGVAMQSLPNLQRIDRLMFEAIVLGFSAYTLGAILHVAWSYEESGKFFVWTRKAVSVLAVWPIYLTYFYGRYRRQWRGSQMAWLAIIGFVVSVLCFTGINLFLIAGTLSAFK